MHARSYPLVGLILLTFFVISFLTNILGPLIPEIIDDFKLSLTLAALLPFAFFIAYGVFSIPAGFLIERVGEKPILVGAFGVAYAGAQLLALFPNYLVAVSSLFLIGSGMAFLQVALNPLLRVAGGEEHFAFNATLGQLSFGLASFLSPLVYTYLVLELSRPEPPTSWGLALLDRLVPPELPWIALYWLFAAVSLLMVGIMALVRLPRVERGADEQAGTLAIYRQLLRQPQVWLFFLGIFAYVGSEQGITNWISEFLTRYHGYDPQTVGARAVSAFWGLMTAGTLLGMVLFKLLDSRIVLRLFTLAALGCLTAALFGPGPIARWAFPLIGLFASVMWPAVFSLALNSVEAHHGAFSGILVTGIAGGAVVPLIIGALGDALGLRGGLCFLYLTFGYILSVSFWARPLITNKTIRWRKREPAR